MGNPDLEKDPETTPTDEDPRAVAVSILQSQQNPKLKTQN